MTVLTREGLTTGKAREIAIERVPMPELGEGAVAILRGMTGTDRDSYESGLVIQKGKRSTVNLVDIRAKLVARCLIDEAGQRLFTDEEVGLVGAMRADLLDRLYKVAQRLCGLSDEDADDLGKSSPSPAGTSSSSN
jgi:hypothetical protein